MSNPWSDIYKEIRKPYLEGLDPVGKEDGDVNNDGKKDSSDSYLMKRRKAIAKAMGKEDKMKKVKNEHHQKDADGNPIEHGDGTEQINELDLDKQGRMKLTSADVRLNSGAYRKSLKDVNNKVYSPVIKTVDHYEPAKVNKPNYSNWREDFVWDDNVDEAAKGKKLDVKENGVKNKIEINPDDGLKEEKKKLIEKDVYLPSDSDRTDMGTPKGLPKEIKRRKDKPLSGPIYHSASYNPKGEMVEAKDDKKKKGVKGIAKELDKAVAMHKSQAKRLRSAGVSEAKVDQGKDYMSKINTRNQRTFGNKRGDKSAFGDDMEVRRYNTKKGRGVKMKGKKDKTPVNYHKRDSETRIDAVMKSIRKEGFYQKKYAGVGKGYETVGKNKRMDKSNKRSGDSKKQYRELHQDLAKKEETLLTQVTSAYVDEATRMKKEMGYNKGGTKKPTGPKPKDAALDAVKKSITAKYGKGAFMRSGSNQPKKVKGEKPGGGGKYKMMADKKKKTAADAKEMGYGKNVKGYIETRARYGSKANMKSGKGLGT